ncbi:MAG: protein-methionine-sulfoxide reductase catalytic subunit MsrP [Acidobacteria bacterium]|nr:protein-methionine-sulfoxide reductase catalytic subunit MsrP [Acidobacteriota bacterium]
MPHLGIRKGWEIPERLATPEVAYLNRRNFLSMIGLTALSYVGLESSSAAQANSPYPGTRNPRYTVDRPLTDELAATRYNNFREFTDQKEAVWMLADTFQVSPWTLKVGGLVRKPRTFDFDQLIRRMPLEERLYRHRCIEGWSMAVPWIGFPFRLLIGRVQPTADARYVLMTSFYRPVQAEAQRRRSQYQWPMCAAITVPEAMNELAFLVTGMYGHDLPKANGAPIRLAVPWKYGFKSIKSIVSIEFTAEQPLNLWNEPGTAPHDFYANVNPDDSGPRYNQARERVIGTWETRPTLPFNGYGPFVAHMYA